MKDIEQLTEDYTTEWFSEAAKEIYRFNIDGLWPLHCPNMNDLKVRLFREGYPPAQVQNIAINYVMMFVLGAFPAIWEAYVEKK